MGHSEKFQDDNQKSMTKIDIKTKTIPKKHFRRPRHLSYFFIDDVGRVFYFKWVKSLAVFLLILVVTSIVIAGIGTKFALNLNRENQTLSEELEKKKEEIHRLRKENEDITVKLIQLGTTDKAVLETTPEEHETLEAPKENATKTASAMPEEGEIVKNVNGGKPDQDILADTVKTGQTISSPTKDLQPAQFEVSNFFVSHNPETKMLNVQFKLAKIAGENGKTEGQTMVVIEGGTENNEIRRVLPVNAKVDGSLAKVVDGKHFLIARYNYIRMSMDFQMDIKFLKNATVLVCDALGNSILKKEFPIAIE